VTLRAAAPRDLALVLDHREKMFAEMGFTTDAVTAQATREFFAAALAEGRYFGWFVEVDGQIAAGGGIVLIAFQPGPVQPGAYRPFVVNMWTEPAHRSQGHARRLMQHMIGWARQQGYGTLHLHASDAGRPLYQSLGFEPTNEMRLRF